jgi:hypothetical protein
MEQGSQIPQVDPAPWRTRRLTWFTVFGGMAASVIFYRIVMALIPPQTLAANGSTIRIAFYILAPLSLILSIVWTRTRLEPAADSSGSTEPPQPPPERFLGLSIIAMAQAEMSAIMGFVLYFMGAIAPAEYLAFGAGTFLVLALVILPRGLAYWGAWQTYEESGSGR